MPDACFIPWIPALVLFFIFLVWLISPRDRGHVDRGNPPKPSPILTMQPLKPLCNCGKRNGNS